MQLDYQLISVSYVYMNEADSSHFGLLADKIKFPSHSLQLENFLLNSIFLLSFPRKVNGALGGLTEEIYHRALTKLSPLFNYENKNKVQKR